MPKKTSKSKSPKLAILVGGGPAPGINGVIRAVTIEAINSGMEVLGIYDGFRWIMEGDTSKVKPLQISDVSRIHTMGGSYLRTSPFDPSRESRTLQNVINSLKKLGVDYLVTIGGDGTSYNAFRVCEALKGKVKVAHVPKTIDNDLPLPENMPTFGFETARHFGTQSVQALMEDAKTCSRWYFVVTMGRYTGHLALGIATSGGATVTVIGEEFKKEKIGFEHLCDILEGAVLKRLAMGKQYGVAVLAEGISERIDAKELDRHGHFERDVYGNLRLEEVHLGQILQNAVQERLKKRGIDLRIASKNIGYELRCMPPVPFDAEYTLNLGNAAVQYLIDGGNGAIVALTGGGKTIPIPFTKLIDIPKKKVRIREVDILCDSYRIARKYMIRLEAVDFKKPERLAALAKTAGVNPQKFKDQFHYLVR